VERGPAVVIGRVLLGVDAIYGTGVHASRVFRSDAGFGNDIGHRPPPPIRVNGMPVWEDMQASARSGGLTEGWIYGDGHSLKEPDSRANCFKILITVRRAKPA